MQTITVIVPVFCVEPHICRCVDSILAQTFSDFELILVDDGSPDGCGTICDDYLLQDERIVVIHQQNGGLSAARNSGINWAFACSDSEWINFVDSDDWVHRQYLELLYKAVKETKADVSSCGFQEVIDYAKEVLISNPVFQAGRLEELLDRINDFRRFNMTIAWGRLYKKNLFMNIQFPVGRLFEDAFIIYKILFSCDCLVCIEHALYYYFSNGNGIMQSSFSEKRICDGLDSLLEQMDYFYRNKSRKLFYIPFRRFCARIPIILNRPEAINITKKYKKTLKSIYNNYKEYLPEEIKKHSYSWWRYSIWKQAYRDKTERFAGDVMTVERERGKLYSLLWAIGHMIRSVF